VDKVLQQREKGAFSSAFDKILCSGLVTRITADTVRGPLGTAASLSLICDEMQAAETEIIQRVSLSDSFASLRHYRI